MSTSPKIPPKVSNGKRIVKVLLGDVREETVVTVLVDDNATPRDVCEKLLAKSWVKDKLKGGNSTPAEAAEYFGLVKEGNFLSAAALPRPRQGSIAAAAVGLAVAQGGESALRERIKTMTSADRYDGTFLQSDGPLGPSNRHIMRRRGTPLRSFATDLWDNIEVVSKRSEEGVAFSRTLKTFFKDVSAAHGEFAKSMQKACATARQSKVLSTSMASAAEDAKGRATEFFDGFSTLVASMEDYAASFSGAADRLADTASMLDSLAKVLQSEQKQLLAEFKDAQKSLAAMRNVLENTHKEFCSASKAAHADSQAVAAADDPAVKQKLMAKKGTSEERMRCCDGEYKTVLGDYNKMVEKFYSTTTPRVFSAFENADLCRLAVVKNIYSNVCTFMRPLGDACVSVADTVDADMANLLPTFDSQIFISGWASGDLPPGPLPYVAWSPGTDKPGGKSKAASLAKKLRSKVGGGSKDGKGPKAVYFGVTLQDIMARQREEGSDLEIPRVLDILIDAILRLDGVQTQGIFRVPAPASAVRELKSLLEDGETTVETYDVSVPAATLKLWLRELSEPLIPADLYDEAIRVARLPDEGERQAAAQAVGQRLPAENLAVVRALMMLFRALLLPENVAATKMPTPNLAMVFAPSFLRTPDPSLLAVNMTFEAAFLESLITAELGLESKEVVHDN